MNNKIKILDVSVDKVDYKEALNRFKSFMNRDGCDIIVTPNSEIVLNATKDESLKEVIENASLVIPDGIGLVYASRYLGKPLKERVTGIDFLSEIFKYCEEEKKSIYIFGSKPGTDGDLSVAEKAGKKINEVYPNLKIAGTHHGYFNENEEQEIVEDINKSGAEFLCVALGSPKQEKFVKKYENQFVNIKSAMGVGGSLDVWSGNVKRAPEFYQKYGLEWLYRFIKEPSRLGRIMKLPLFLIKVVIKGKN